jgi:hypothetical protein
MSIVIMIDECPSLFCTTIDGRLPLSALDAFVADQREPVSHPEAIRVILMKFLRSNGYLPKTSGQ